MTTQKDRIEAAIRHIQTSVDIDLWAMELAVEALKGQLLREDATKDTTNDDIISRQAAIDALEEYLEEYDGFDEHGLHSEKWCAMSEAKMAIEALPSAQPEPHYDEWCTDCKEYDHERHCCPRWNRVIRETLKDAKPEVIRCKDCTKCQIDSVFDEYWCDGRKVSKEHYCGYAERRTDENR